MTSELIEFIEQELVGEDIDLTEESDLLGGGIIDSLGIMRLISHIETQYEIKIPADEMVIENFMTVAAINTYLTSKK